MEAATALREAAPGRIVLLTTSYPQPGDDAAGHFVRTEARALAALGHDVHVVCPGDAPERAAGVTVWPVGGGAAFGTPGVMARVRAAPWRALQWGGFAHRARVRLRALSPLDRMVAHFVVPCGWPLALGVDAELEVVAHGSDVRLLMAAPRVVRHALFRQLVAQGARFRFAAHALMDALDVTSRALIAERSVVRLPPVAVPDGWNGASLRPGYGAPMVVVVGRLVRDKRVDRAIDAMRAGELVVIGDGPERSRLVARAAQRGIAARFVGQLPRSQALEHIAAADVLLHASSLEGASTVIREARALGTAVVCCDAGDAARWAESDPGIHVSAPDDLGATLARVLSALG